MLRFRVLVPFEPVIHETLDSRVFTNIPDSDLAGGLRIRGTDDGYIADLELQAVHPGAAKATAVQVVKSFLEVLASWSHGFQIQIGGVWCELVDNAEPVPLRHATPGVVAITASDTSFTENHVQAVVRKASLGPEDAFYRRLDELSKNLRNCLELNYLLVLSTSPPIRWLLAATGMEARALGTTEARQTVKSRLDVDQRRQLRREIRLVLDAVGLDELGERVVGRVLSSTLTATSATRRPLRTCLMTIARNCGAYA